MEQDPPEQGEYEAAPYQLATWLVLGIAIVLILGLSAVRMPNQPDTSRDYPSRALPAHPEPQLLPPPEMDDEYWPCSDCHEDEPANHDRRELEDDHEDHKISHGDLWCLSCHDPDNRDRLHLADGTLVKFEDSWQLCTQCHAKKLHDWRAGVHGKRTGHWRGAAEYRTCVACHNPHSPPFEPLAPKPPPWRPEQITKPESADGGNAHEAS